ncbi:MAG: leucine-rich repeat domain-containing protein [Capnocytophaga granulosa]
MKSIILEKTMLINRRAFKNCSLKSITINNGSQEGVQFYGINIYETDVEQLRKTHLIDSLVLPKDLIIIGGYAFSGCKSLKTVEFPSYIVIVGEKAFENCKELEKVIFPNDMPNEVRGREIENEAFSGCSALKSIVLPKGIRIIDIQAFRDCTALEEVEIGEDIKLLADRAFYGCNLLKTIKIKTKTPPTLGKDVFPNLNIDIEIPKGSRSSYENAWSMYKDRLIEK